MSSSRYAVTLTTVVALVLTAAAALAATTFAVHADYSERMVGTTPHTSFASTGISVQAGDRLVITATGTACPIPADECGGPDGSDELAPEGMNFLAPGLPGATLVGRFGTSGDPFMVGSTFDATVAAAGVLYLGFNDSRSDDNSGAFSVTISVNPDQQAPAVTDTAADPNPVVVGGVVTVTAVVDDIVTGGSDIASAAVSLDGGATWTSATATDGAFDGPVEAVTGSVTAPASADLYRACVRGTDAAGNTSEPVCVDLPVYNADAGALTGGGWIDSPAGAYPSGSAEGRANFGLTARYQPNGTLQGEVEFDFPAGDLSFHSTELDWLVVNGARAHLAGTGTVNGTDGHRFVVTVHDAPASGAELDRVRVKIWDADGDVVYDNQPGAPHEAAATDDIEGGSLAIRGR